MLTIIVIAIACNKIDLAAQRVVSVSEVARYAQSVGASVHETSAKTNEGVCRSQCMITYL